MGKTDLLEIASGGKARPRNDIVILSSDFENAIDRVNFQLWGRSVLQKKSH
jgi:hypothetical protein